MFFLNTDYQPSQFSLKWFPVYFTFTDALRQAPRASFVTVLLGKFSNIRMRSFCNGIPEQLMHSWPDWPWCPPACVRARPVNPRATNRMDARVWPASTLRVFNSSFAFLSHNDRTGCLFLFITISISWFSVIFDMNFDF